MREQGGLPVTLSARYGVRLSVWACRYGSLGGVGWVTGNRICSS
nr:envelope glycoprotein L [Human alphaherpesvirus 2]